jgi:hypothetical protein
VRCAAAKPRVNAEKPRFFINAHNQFASKLKLFLEYCIQQAFFNSSLQAYYPLFFGILN